jgi:hypothetical protein
MDAAVQKRSRRGLFTVLVIFLFGGLFVGGLYYNARRNAAARPEYSSASVGIPTQDLTIISCNLNWDTPVPAPFITSLNMYDADFILLQQVAHKDAQFIAEALNMKHAGQLQLYYSPTNPNTTQVPGNAILSRHPIYQGRAISNGGATDAGIWVEPVIGGKRFLLGNVDLSPPPLAAPAAVLRSEAIATLVRSWDTIEEPYVIGGVMPLSAARSRPGKEVTLIRDRQIVARCFLSPHWNFPRGTSYFQGGRSFAIIEVPASPSRPSPTTRVQ